MCSRGIVVIHMELPSKVRSGRPQRRLIDAGKRGMQMVDLTEEN